jgi:hypothetical protein
LRPGARFRFRQDRRTWAFARRADSHGLTCVEKSRHKTHVITIFLLIEINRPTNAGNHPATGNEVRIGTFAGPDTVATEARSGDKHAPGDAVQREPCAQGARSIAQASQFASLIKQQKVIDAAPAIANRANRLFERREFDAVGYDAKCRRSDDEKKPHRFFNPMRLFNLAAAPQSARELTSTS